MPRWFVSWFGLPLALLIGAFGIAEEVGARVKCQYSGSKNLLVVTASGESRGEIRREKRRIVVGEAGGQTRRCGGGRPTVLNTDTIRVNPHATHGVALRLGGGPLAPGATPESEGVSEIEVRSVLTAFDPRVGTLKVVGTSQSETFHWSPGRRDALGSPDVGLNLNYGTAGDEDADVTVRGTFADLFAVGGGGDDRIVPQPGARVVGSVQSYGGTGNDVLITPRLALGGQGGGRGNDKIVGGKVADLVSGGPGNDRIASARGNDLINGGRGRDRLNAGPGRDLIESRDTTRERVRCGPGPDRVKADTRDRVRNCEVVRRR